MSKLTDDVIKSIQKSINEDKIVDIEELRDTEEFFNEDFMQQLDLELNEAYELLNEAFIPYMNVIMVLGIMNEMLLQDDKLKKIRKKIKECEDRFLPGSLFSPISQLNFECWKLFDLQIDQEGTSLGEMSLKVVQTVGNLEDDITGPMVEKAASSFMNFYVYQGRSQNQILLQEIFSGCTYNVISSDEFDIDIGSIIFTRLIASADDSAIFLNLMSAHHLINVTKKDVTDYFIANNILPNDLQAIYTLRQFMKKQSSDLHFLQFIHENYLDTTDNGIIQVVGLPSCR